ncbi:ATP-binding cassette sub-family C member 4-like [Gigantopelta aegis]|uniref:ATP-binding cassette sub-family C member 4-like n=1 Tax=Gigantopelta aegis TaxID=1735272 RepID=UPI001B88C8D5|nr:ATP-binding cassette sub-family C member 4-like [Gigantopelta aegis]
MLHKSVIFKESMLQLDWAVEIDHVTARWEITLPEVVRRRRKRDSTSDTSRLLHESELEHYFSLKNITITVKKGELLAVIGSVGSGKSSLLLTLLGELPHQQGQITLLGKVGYYSQQAWIFSGTVRDNVVFGGELDEARYTAVLEACALNKDIESMTNGDLTLVGERGLMLSGGQKARLSLARALYRNVDIYLLDDPLSAVDTKVGKHIFNKCLLQMLAGKTRIVVTHQLQYLQKVDRIVVLREGTLYDVGTYSELTSRGVDIATFIKTEETPTEDTDTNMDVDDMLLLSSTAEELQAEDSETGTVGWSVYWQYFKAGYGYFLSPVVIIFVIGERSLMVAADWMLAKWAESVQFVPSHLRNETTLPVLNNASVFHNKYLATTSTILSDPGVKDWAHMPQTLQYFVIFVCGFVVCATVFSVTHYQLCAFASQRLHDKMFKFVLGAKTQFFDSNPVGRILNRFSRDLGFVDDPMTRCLYVVIDFTMLMFSTTVVVCMVSPWLLIAVIPVAMFVIFIRYFAIRTTRQIRRLEAVSRSPVYSHVSDTIGGLQTIRAFGKQDQFTESFDGYQNHHSSAWFLYLASYRWFSIRSLFAVIVFYNIIIQVCLVLRNSISSGLLAMILIYSSAWMEPFEFIMRMSAELENYMTSVQRILSYSKVEQEKSKRSDKPPPPDWPMRGSITFTDVSLRYTDNTPWALKHIDFHIKSKEKIGVVGRTGAGKSSLLASLFRLAEPTGKIWIDGLDVTKIGLHELREKISIIPQDPTLFSGTLRKNLDPFDEYRDEDMWYALEQVQLKKTIERASGKLCMEVSESGHNFSVGQRQLICLARAILRYNKILILDEATANVDHRTDEFIQMTLRSKFRSCTVLTVAHRLNTVMDCDRIMVLDDGELKEFDIPYNLLQIKDGYFSQLVEQTGGQQAAHLRMLAQIAFGQRASASLLLEEAVKTATLHLRNSRDDLSKSRESLKSSQELVKKSLDCLDSIDRNTSQQSPQYSDQRQKERGDDIPKRNVSPGSNVKMNSRSPKFRDSVPIENVIPRKYYHSAMDKGITSQSVTDNGISSRKSVDTNPPVLGDTSRTVSAAKDGDQYEPPSADGDRKTPAASSHEISQTEPLLRGDSEERTGGNEEPSGNSSAELLPRKFPYNPSPLARDQNYLKRISGGPTGRGARFITGVYKPSARTENESSDEDPLKIIYC